METSFGPKAQSKIMSTTTNKEAKGDHIRTWMDAWIAGGNFPAMMLGVYDNHGT